MVPRILLLNPPIYDFTAYDFWLKPYGLLSVAGMIADSAEMVLFDYMDRLADPSRPAGGDQWSRGRFRSIRLALPTVFSEIPRYFHRFGRDRAEFQQFCAEQEPFDFVLIQTTMTYWYLGLEEVIADVRKFLPSARIVLGGFYATACTEHAKRLGGDLVINGSDLGPLWRLLNVKPNDYRSPYWQGYDRLDVGVLKLSDGCPFSCTYCFAGSKQGQFSHRRLSDCIADLELLVGMGVKDIAFYDDSLLYQPQPVLVGFLRHIIDKNIRVNFHTPNALGARFITAALAELMVEAGFKTFYLGFESSSETFQRRTGSKVFSQELTTAAEHLLSADANASNITVYGILGHPHTDLQQLQESMYFANSLGVRVMLADFSPLPGTVDGEYCRRWIDLDEPLNHNKTAFPIILLGNNEVNRLKDLCRHLNRTLRDEDV